MLVSKPKGRWTTYAINKEYQQTPEQICLSDIEVPGVQLNATDRAIYQYLKTNGIITARQVTTITKIGTVSGANVALKRMIARGLVVKKGTSHNTYYALTKAGQ